MFGLGFTEILVVLAVVLLVMGPERMPEFARTLGRTMWQLRKAGNDFRAEVQLSALDIDRDILSEEIREIRGIADDCPDNPKNEAPPLRVEQNPAEKTKPLEEPKDS